MSLYDMGRSTVRVASSSSFTKWAEWNIEKRTAGLQGLCSELLMLFNMNEDNHDISLYFYLCMQHKTLYFGVFAQCSL